MVRAKQQEECVLKANNESTACIGSTSNNSTEHEAADAGSAPSAQARNFSGGLASSILQCAGFLPLYRMYLMLDLMRIIHGRQRCADVIYIVCMCSAMSVL